MTNEQFEELVYKLGVWFDMKGYVKGSKGKRQFTK